MRCVIPGRSVKLFGRSIHCLGKIGDELYIEALQENLVLRTVNSSRSAYASCTFKTQFFQEYHQSTEPLQSSNDADMLKCKLTMKSCLTIFKSLPSLEKVVEQCVIELKHDECRFVFTMYCRQGITKTFNLTYQECESLQAVFSKELCPNQFAAQSRLFLDSVSNFPVSCEEITLTSQPEEFKLNNYVEDESDPTKVVRTEMTLVPEEFENYQIGVDAKITFCLKEFRAILAFSEFVSQPLSVYFEASGKPIVFSLDSDDMYLADFVMATLSEQQLRDSQLTSQRVNTSKASSQRNQSTNRTKINPPKQKDSIDHMMDIDFNDNDFDVSLVPDERPSISKLPNSKNKNNVSGPSLCNSKSLANSHSRKHISKNTDNNNTNCTSTTNTTDERPKSNGFMSESFSNQNISVDRGLSANRENGDLHPSRPISTPQSSVISTAMKNVSLPKVGDTSHGQEEEEDLMDVLMGTPPPPKKKAKLSFFGVAPKVAKIPAKTDVVLAADTDSEDD